jgi:hypothetical protein
LLDLAELAELRLVELLGVADDRDHGLARERRLGPFLDSATIECERSLGTCGARVGLEYGRGDVTYNSAMNRLEIKFGFKF